MSTRNKGVGRHYNGKERHRRLAAYERAGWACANCREVLPQAGLTLDHIVPRARGGDSRRENLAVLCATCNVAKGDDVWPHLFDRSLAAQS